MKYGNECVREPEDFLSCGMRDRLTDTYKPLKYLQVHGKALPPLHPKVGQLRPGGNVSVPSSCRQGRQSVSPLPVPFRTEHRKRRQMRFSSSHVVGRLCKAP